MSASARFRLSLLILLKDRSLSDLLDFIRSASACVISLNSGSSLKLSSLTLLDTPLKTKMYLQWRLQSDMTLEVTP